MLRRIATIVATATFIVAAIPRVANAEVPVPLTVLARDVRSLAAHIPAPTALEVFDLSTGFHAGFNATQSMPAASTIKIPVMVEVFRQLQKGKYNLDRRVTLLARDKDWGSGELCDAPVGTTYSITDLLEKMIDISDNTATNMLIRLVGRKNINVSMRELGLTRTSLSQDIRTSDWSVRSALRTSPHDLVHLLELMARRQLVDEWSSNEMISILEEDQINTLLPQPLPDDIEIAHKTGSFFDTLNDAGIVYADNAPYVIAVMTTALPSQNIGRSFIHSLSRLVYSDELSFARWRQSTGFATAYGLRVAPTGMTPDLRYWSTGSTLDVGSGGGGGY
ncbi:MAG TPA: serine hydrolase [Candidatus Baltobacteraceae bacterium]|nr:serine hydrolase [Candidatus Baltobacteraceae bacterium]